MRFTIRTSLLAIVIAALAAAGLSSPPRAAAYSRQISMFEDDSGLLSDPLRTLREIRHLGAQWVRLALPWIAIAPDPYGNQRPSFDATDPAAYSGWGPWDQAVIDTQASGIGLDLLVTGAAPLWATGGGKPPGGRFPQWEPNAHEFGLFVQAVAKRYSGTYTPPGQARPLPRVQFWEIWNEPNFGPDLAPQATHGSTVPTGPRMYRGLVDAAWGAFQATGHGRDTIVLGSLDARGLSGPPNPHLREGFPGDFAGTKPLIFVRDLYCVDSHFRELRGKAAAGAGCPTTAAGSRDFAAAHPALFKATAFSDHPYPSNGPPIQAGFSDPDYAELNEIPRLEYTLDRAQRIYGSHKRFPIYNTEYGYITNPPNNMPGAHFVSPATAAYYLNWAEYISWRNPRLESYMQYLLYDPYPKSSGFDTGLLFYNGVQKPTYAAFRMPLYLPVSSTRHRRSLEVWGCVRPAHFAQVDTGATQFVQIQFQRLSRGRWQTLKTVAITNPSCYFTARVVFPSSGSVRLAWTYPPQDPAFNSTYVDPLSSAQTVYSRTATVTVR